MDSDSFVAGGTKVDGMRLVASLILGFLTASLPALYFVDQPDLAALGVLFAFLATFGVGLPVYLYLSRRRALRPFDAGSYGSVIGCVCAVPFAAGALGLALLPLFMAIFGLAGLPAE